METVETTASFDEMCMTMVFLVAMRSKDQSTHIGAVVVGPDKEIRSVGWNGFARGIKDDVDSRQERPEKYFWMVHAERNSVYNATLMGVSLKDCVMYTNGLPCADCAQAVIQSGIKEVVVYRWWDENNSGKWKEHAERSAIMLKEAGVKVRTYGGELLKIHALRNGEVIDLYGL